MSKKIIFSSLAFISISFFSLTTHAIADENENATTNSHVEIMNDSTGKTSENVNNSVARGYQTHGSYSNLQQILNNLTPDQEKELEQITQKYIKETNPLFVQLAANSAAYNALMLNDNPSPKEAGKLAGSIIETKQAITTAENQYLNTIAEKFNIYVGTGPSN